MNLIRCWVTVDVDWELLFAEIYDMQVSAIMEAAIEVQKAGNDC